MRDFLDPGLATPDVEHYIGFELTRIVEVIGVKDQGLILNIEDPAEGALLLSTRVRIVHVDDMQIAGAAVTAMLDRLLHHGHILKCGPRSWRTKTDLPDQEKLG